MIKRVRLRAFKSAVNDVEIEFAPLTIVAGPNSSGKSTLLQSILLLSQTLASKASSRALVLNGNLVRLGTFDEVHSYGSRGRMIRIGMDMDLSNVGSSGTSIAQVSTGLGSAISTRNITMDVEFSKPTRKFAAENHLDPQQPQLNSFRMTTSTSLPEPRSSATASMSAKARQTKAGPALDTPFGDIGQSFNVKLDSQSNADMNRANTGVEVEGMLSNHFLPRRLLIRSNPALELANEWVLSLLLLGDSGRSNPGRGTRSIFPKALVSALRHIVLNASKEADFPRGAELDADTWAKWFSTLSEDQRSIVRPALFAEVQQLFQTAIDATGLPREEPGTRPLPRQLAMSMDRVEAFLGSRVRYLGPLREEPRPIYSLSAEVDPTSVGTKGEFTAAVLSANSNARIRYIAPPGPSGTLKTRRLGTLGEAVDAWLSYLGVASTAESADLGSQGHTLKVTQSTGGKSLDMTQVGVGVSQLLPIVVMCLLASPGSVVILEQPELHMHPRVQALLADFLLAVTKSGVQCVVETHSEYLISRIRLRVAETKVDPARDAVLLFTEVKSGETHYRALQLNEYGSIDDWPEGFFDTSSHESSAILRAALERRRANSQ
ncbi:MAG: hypothetical protein JWR04_964 [Rhodoglobus sp.]|nr:hypothetical protein [Rhodoglobus sp.]